MTTLVRTDTIVVLRSEALAQETALEALRAFRYLVHQLERHLAAVRSGAAVLDTRWVIELQRDIAITAEAYSQALDA